MQIKVCGVKYEEQQEIGTTRSLYLYPHPPQTYNHGEVKRKKGFHIPITFTPKQAFISRFGSTNILETNEYLWWGADAIALDWEWRERYKYKRMKWRT